MYHKGNYVGMRKWLGKIEWEDIMSKCSLEEICTWSKFCEKIQQATAKFVPVFKGKSRHYPNSKMDEQRSKIG
jgi:hypothetical protein